MKQPLLIFLLAAGIIADGLGADPSATVQVRNLPGLAKLKAAAIHPGAGHPLPVKTQFNDGILELTVPLKRGCAMVQLTLPK